VLSRFAEIGGQPVRLPSGGGLCDVRRPVSAGLLKHLSGDKKAVATMQSNVRLVVSQLVGPPVAVKGRQRALAA